MPVYFRPNEFYVKNPNGSGYLPQNVLAEQSTAEIIETIDEAVDDARTELNTIISGAQTAVDQIEDQKQTMIASIASVAGQGTDTTLSQSGVAADAAKTGEAVNSLKNDFSYFKTDINPNDLGSVPASVSMDGDSNQDCVLAPIQKLDGKVSANVLCPFNGGTYWDTYPIKAFLVKELYTNYLEVIDLITFNSTTVSGTSNTAAHYEWRELLFSAEIKSTETYYIVLSRTTTSPSTPTVGYKEFAYSSSLTIGGVVQLTGSVKTDLTPQFYASVYGLNSYDRTKSIVSTLKETALITELSNVLETNTTYSHSDTGTTLAYVDTFPWLTIANKIARLLSGSNLNNTWAILAESATAFVIMNYSGSKYYIKKDLSSVVGMDAESISLPMDVMIDGNMLYLGNMTITLSELNAELTKYSVSDTMTNLRLGISCNKSIAGNELPFVFSATIDNLKAPTLWRGKTGDFLGDSLTQQGYFTGAMASLYDIVVNNYGVSGTTISNINSSNMFYTRISSMSTSCDFVFVMGGTNDWGLGAPLGSAASLTDNDYSNFYNALYSTFGQLRTRFPSKPIFVSTITPRNWQGGGQASGIWNNGNGVSLMQFNDAIKFIAGVFGCHVIDGFASGINVFNLSTCTADNLHFNEAGGARFATYCMDMMNQITPY